MEKGSIIMFTIKKKNKKIKEEAVIQLEVKKEEIIPKKLEQDYDNRPIITIMDKYKDNSILVAISGGCGNGEYELSISERDDLISLTWISKEKHKENVVWVSDNSLLLKDFDNEKTYYLRARQTECLTHEASRIGLVTHHTTPKKELDIEDLMALREEATELFGNPSPDIEDIDNVFGRAI